MFLWRRTSRRKRQLGARVQALTDFLKLGPDRVKSGSLGQQIEINDQVVLRVDDSIKAEIIGKTYRHCKGPVWEIVISKQASQRMTDDALRFTITHEIGHMTDSSLETEFLGFVPLAICSVLLAASIRADSEWAMAAAGVAFGLSVIVSVHLYFHRRALRSQSNEFNADRFAISEFKDLVTNAMKDPAPVFDQLIKLRNGLPDDNWAQRNYSSHPTLECRRDRAKNGRGPDRPDS